MFDDLNQLAIWMVPGMTVGIVPGRIITDLTACCAAMATLAIGCIHCLSLFKLFAGVSVLRLLRTTARQDKEAQKKEESERFMNERHHDASQHGFLVSNAFIYPTTVSYIFATSIKYYRFKVGRGVMSEARLEEMC